MHAPPDPRELLCQEEAQAWIEYLDATRGQEGKRYAEVETWAWARLDQRLSLDPPRGWVDAVRC